MDNLFGDVEPVVDNNSYVSPHENEVARAMVLFAFNEGIFLFFTGNDVVRDYIEEVCTEVDSGFRRISAKDWNHKSGDGIFICDMGWCATGISDWDCREAEYDLVFTSCRLATEKEWKDFLSEDWVWEPTSKQT